LPQSDEDSAEELEALEGGGVDDSGNALKRQQQIAPAAPSFLCALPPRPSLPRDVAEMC